MVRLRAARLPRTSANRRQVQNSITPSGDFTVARGCLFYSTVFAATAVTAKTLLQSMTARGERPTIRSRLVSLLIKRSRYQSGHFYTRPYMSEEHLDDFKVTLVDGLKGNSLTSCSRWSARRRIMGGDFPGPYTWKYHPWTREMHDSPAGFNYAMKGAQLGVTEVVINRSFYIIDRLKRDVLYVLPTTVTATDFSKARFGGALALSPYLKSLFTDTNAVGLKQAGENVLYIRGSRGDSNLVSIPVSELILDEVDRMEQSQVWLALERLSGKLHKHVWGISTPTIPNYGIHKLYNSSTQEHFMFQCPCCSRQTELIFPECLELRGEHVTDARCAESFLKCKECGGKLEHADKPNFLKNAYWEAFDKNANPEVRGFHISQLYSFTVTPGELAVAYFRGFGDELAQKEFHNSKLGKPFIGDGAKVDDVMLDKCIAIHTKDDERPSGPGRLITMGIDRGKWNYLNVDEWFIDGFSSDINASAFCKTLFQYEFHENDFNKIADEAMREWQVLACVIDADPGPNEARQFARRFEGFVWLCRYRGRKSKEITISEEEGGAPMATVDRSHWISAALGRFKTSTPRIALPQDISHNYREHIKAVVATYIRDDDGNPQLDYVSTGADHFAHARTYSEIALPFAASLTTGQNITKFL